MWKFEMPWHRPKSNSCRDGKVVSGGIQCRKRNLGKE
jgi:hypothetical protein